MFAANLYVVTLNPFLKSLVQTGMVPFQNTFQFKFQRSLNTFFILPIAHHISIVPIPLALQFLVLTLTLRGWLTSLFKIKLGNQSKYCHLKSDFWNEEMEKKNPAPGEITKGPVEVMQ